LRVQQLGGRLDEAASNDKAITTVGVILFWPILSALGGTKQQEAEYARLKGEYDALQQMAIAKKCPGVVPAAGTTAASAMPAGQSAAVSGSVTLTTTPAAATSPVPTQPIGDPA